MQNEKVIISIETYLNCLIYEKINERTLLTGSEVQSYFCMKGFNQSRLYDM